MSGSTSLSSAAFTDAEKADVRRFCGYPAFGAANNGFQNWRFYQAYGLLEFRMNNLAPAEFQNVRLKLNDLYALELAIPLAGLNMGTDIAAVWTRNRSEVRDRTNLFNEWRRTLCGILGVPSGAALANAGSVTLVV